MAKGSTGYYSQELGKYFYASPGEAILEHKLYIIKIRANDTADTYDKTVKQAKAKWKHHEDHSWLTPQAHLFGISIANNGNKSVDAFVKLMTKQGWLSKIQWAKKGSFLKMEPPSPVWKKKVKIADLAAFKSGGAVNSPAPSHNDAVEPVQHQGPAFLKLSKNEKSQIKFIDDAQPGDMAISVTGSVFVTWVGNSTTGNSVEAPKCKHKVTAVKCLWCNPNQMKLNPGLVHIVFGQHSPLGPEYTFRWRLSEHIDDKDDEDYAGDSEEKLAHPDDANLMCSDVTVSGNWHMPVIDLDVPVRFIPSSTPGHGHLVLGKVMSKKKYFALLDALVDAGIVESGFAQASKDRGYSAVRPPWSKKPAQKVAFAKDLDAKIKAGVKWITDNDPPFNTVVATVPDSASVAFDEVVVGDTKVSPHELSQDSFNKLSAALTTASYAKLAQQAAHAQEEAVITGKVVTGEQQAKAQPSDAKKHLGILGPLYLVPTQPFKLKLLTPAGHYEVEIDMAPGSKLFIPADGYGAGSFAVQHSKYVEQTMASFEQSWKGPHNKQWMVPPHVADKFGTLPGVNLYVPWPHENVSPVLESSIVSTLFKLVISWVAPYKSASPYAPYSGKLGSYGPDDKLTW